MAFKLCLTCPIVNKLHQQNQKDDNNAKLYHQSKLKNIRLTVTGTIVYRWQDKCTAFNWARQLITLV